MRCGGISWKRPSGTARRRRCSRRSSSRLASAELLPGSNCRSQTNRVTPAPTVSSSRCSRSRRSPGGTRSARRRARRRRGARSSSWPAGWSACAGRLRRTSGPGPRSTAPAVLLRGALRRAHAPRRPRRTGSRTRPRNNQRGSRPAISRPPRKGPETAVTTLWPPVLSGATIPLSIRQNRRTAPSSSCLAAQEQPNRRSVALWFGVQAGSGSHTGLDGAERRPQVPRESSLSINIRRFFGGQFSMSPGGQF